MVRYRGLSALGDLFRDMHAVVVIGGKQYIVQKGDRLTVDRLPDEEGKTVHFDRVLLTTDGKKTTVGAPIINGEKVSAKILSHGKGQKMDIYRFKSKVRYRRVHGHRQAFTEVKITAIKA